MRGTGGLKLKAKKGKFTRKPWSNVPVDIISLIINHLHYADQIRVRAVCKSWRAAKIEKYADKLPWVMGYNYDACSCFLYNPYEKRKYTVFYSNTNIGNFDGAKALEAKHGWVLFFNSKTSSLFFYSPFTSNIIEQVPKLYINIEAATFSTSPLSPDCVIFVGMIDCPGHYCTINICKPGDKGWTNYRFGLSGRFGTRFLTAEYVKGVFYCILMADDSLIGGFDVGRKMWITYRFPLKRSGWEFYKQEHLIESEGNLLLAYHTNNCQYISHYYGDLHYAELVEEDGCEWNVVRCDPSKMDWMEVERLDSGALFLGGQTSIFIPETGTSELANTFHYRIASFERPFSCPCFPYQTHPTYYPPCLHDWDGNFPVFRDINSPVFRDIWIQPPPPQYL